MSGTNSAGVHGEHDIDFRSFMYSDSFHEELRGQKDYSMENSGKLDAPVSGNSRNEFVNSKHRDDNDYSLEFWKDFPSLKEAHGTFPTTWALATEATSREHPPGMKPANSED